LPNSQLHAISLGQSVVFAAGEFVSCGAIRALQSAGFIAARSSINFSHAGDIDVRFFSYLLFYELREFRPRPVRRDSEQKAPEFTCRIQDGKDLSLHISAQIEAVALIFYRGFGDHYATPSCGVFSKGFRTLIAREFMSSQ